jgi:hypothetical protein
VTPARIAIDCSTPARQTPNAVGQGIKINVWSDHLLGPGSHYLNVTHALCLSNQIGEGVSRW